MEKEHVPPSALSAANRQLESLRLESAAALLMARKEVADLQRRLQEAQRQGEAEAVEYRRLAVKALDLEDKLQQASQRGEAQALEAQRQAQLLAQAQIQLRQMKSAGESAQAEAGRAGQRAAELEAKRQQAEQRAAEEAAKSRSLAAQAAELQARLRQAEQGAAEEAAKARGLAAQAAELEGRLGQVEQRAAQEAARTRQLCEQAEQLQARLQESERLAAEATAKSSQLSAQVQESEALHQVEAPALESFMDPGWAKALGMLRQYLATAYAHLRKLSALRLLDDQRARLKEAAGALTHGRDLLSSLMEFWEEAAPAPSVARLEPAVAAALSAWEPTLRLRAIKSSRQQEGSLPLALFHAEGLRLALYQVLRNAYESMPRGGALAVKLFKDESAGLVCVSFSDTGPGFSPEALARLPMAFTSSRPGHLGLGLPLTRRLLERWGGSLEVANNGKKGATVTLRFALSREEAPPLDGEPLG